MGHHQGMGDGVVGRAPSHVVGRAPSRGRHVGLDMVRSLGLVALVLLGILWLGHPRTPDPVRAVEWGPVADHAAAQAGFVVLAPPPALSWVATSARVEPQPDGTLVWRVGFLTPQGDYAALLQRGVFPEQASQAQQAWLAGETRNGVPEGAVDLADLRWTRSVGDPTPDDRRSLVLDEGGTTTIVTGSASWSELEQLAGMLRPVPVEPDRAVEPERPVA